MASAAPTRLTGLDLFRGLTVAGMIIVNTPGNENYVWWPLDHAPWNGFTPTDLVFPAFLFAVGVALGLSFPRIVDGATWRRVVRRTVSLIALGWAWQMLARPGIASFRLMGVLPRIGLCYGIVTTFVLLTARKDSDGRSRLSPGAIAIAASVMLAGYTALMLLVPVPGHGAGQLTPDGSLASYVDQQILTPAHMWRFGTATPDSSAVVYDPEGLLSTLPSLANVLFGLLAALWWQRAPDRAPRGLVVGGVVLMAAGLAVTPLMPLNKSLWSSSFALFSSGLSAILLALAMVVSGREVLRRWMTPFRLLGMNAIMGYMVSLLLALAGARIHIGGRKLGVIAFETMRALIPDPYIASFACALAVLALVIGLIVPLHRRGIHLRL